MSRHSGESSPRVIIDQDNPWPGLEAFYEGAADFFNGRDSESRDLLARVRQAHLTVLYGKSGLGKTSLLKAGLFPLLRREHILPVYVRLDVEDRTAPILEQAVSALKTELQACRVDAPAFLPGETLWEFVHRKDLELWSSDNWPLIPLLVFDQMEEIFTRGSGNLGAIQQLRTDLADLVENRIPVPLARRIEAGESFPPFALDGRQAKYLFSFREDFLPDFEGWRQDIPSLMLNPIRLKRMTGEEAFEAVYKTGLKIVDENLAREIVRFISGPERTPETEQTETTFVPTAPPVQEIEPAVLSILCRGLNERRKEQKKDKIERQLLGETSKTIIDEFYRNAIADIPEQVQEFIGEKLITERGYRNTCALEDVQQGGITEELLQKLVDRRILRLETRGQIKWLELTHDLLTPSIMLNRDKQRRRRAEEHHKAEIEQQALLRRNKIYLGFIGLLLIAIFISIGLGLKACDESNLAKAGQLAASADGQLRVDPQLSVLLAVEAVKTKDVPEAEAALRVALIMHHQRKILKGHEGPVVHATFSPDGRTVVTASWDGTARLWDAKNGGESHVLRHERAVYYAAFSPDGRTVVTASGDGTARLWDASGGTQLRVLNHGNSVAHAAFSPNGKLVVTASYDNTTRLWDASTGKPRYVLQGHEGPVNHAAFNCNGKVVVTASYDNTARLWDTSSGKPGYVLRGHKASVTHAAFSPDPDGKFVVTASEDYTARLWIARGGEPRYVLRGHKGRVCHADFSPDGKFVATASWDKTARLWDTSTGRELHVLQHREYVTRAAFSPDGRSVVTASGDKTARLWDTSSGKELYFLRGHKGPVKHAAFSPDGKLVVTASKDKTARFWNASSERELAGLGHKGPVYRADISPDGKVVVTASGDKTGCLWDSSSGKPGYVLRGHEGPLTDANFSPPDGKLVVTASGDNTARLWNASTGEPRYVLQGHEGPVYRAAFSPDGKVVVTASYDKTARLWNASTGEPRYVLQGHEGPVYRAAFSPDAVGKFVVTASEDKTVRLWDAGTGRGLHVLRGHEDRVCHADFSPDGKLVVTASWDNTARLWDTSTGEPLYVLRGHLAPVNHATFSPDGKVVVTAGEDMYIRLWDTSTGKELHVLEGHGASVYHAAFSPDAVGKFVVTASEDKTVRLWDTSTGRELHVLQGHEDRVNHAAFSRPDGKTLVTSSHDGTARLWQCIACYPLQELLKLAEDRKSRDLTDKERERYLP